MSRDIQWTNQGTTIYLAVIKWRLFERWFEVAVSKFEVQLYVAHGKKCRIFHCMLKNS